jgi:hypothetical protein
MLQQHIFCVDEQFRAFEAISVCDVNWTFYFTLFQSMCDFHSIEINEVKA